MEGAGRERELRKQGWRGREEGREKGREDGSVVKSTFWSSRGPGFEYLIPSTHMGWFTIIRNFSHRKYVTLF